MPSLKMSLGLRIRSKVNWVQNISKKTKTLSLSSNDHMMPIKFTETIHDVLKMHAAFKIQPRQELSIWPRQVKGHFSANFAKTKV